MAPFDEIDRIMTEVDRLLATPEQRNQVDAFIRREAVDDSMVGVLHALVGDLRPPDLAEPTRGKAGSEFKAGTWAEMKQNTCLFGEGQFVVARVFPTGEPTEMHVPDENPADRVRVYYVERGVEMCLGVKNFMNIPIAIEPFYVHPDETEASEGLQELPALGRSQVELKSELGEGETRDGWRLKDQKGEVVLTVYMQCVGA